METRMERRRTGKGGDRPSAVLPSRGRRPDAHVFHRSSSTCLPTGPSARLQDTATACTARYNRLDYDAYSVGLYLSNFIRGVEVLAIEVDDRANA